MILPLSRVTAIWCGVGLGHLAAIGAIWGDAGIRDAAGDGLIVVELLAPEPSQAPLARIEALPALSPAPDVPPPAPPVNAAAAIESAPVIAAAPARAVQATAGGFRPTAPEFLERVEPLYPRAARLAGVEGVARLRLRLDGEGRLESLEVAVSSGSESLDAAAMEAARRSRYAPARLGPAGVPSETEATYRFRLR